MPYYMAIHPSQVMIDIENCGIASSVCISDETAVNCTAWLRDGLNHTDVEFKLT